MYFSKIKFSAIMSHRLAGQVITGFILCVVIVGLSYGSSEGQSSLTERASPEVGYGDKTEAEIMQEKPRLPRIAVLGPMEGDLSLYGMEASNGAELASDEINENGGINGKQYELLVFDTKGSITGTRVGVEALLKHRAIAIVGAATAEVSFSANKMINDNQMIIISAGSRRRLGDTGPYNFRNTLNDQTAIKRLVEFTAREKKWAKFALFSSVINDYSIKLTAAFKAELINQGLTITDELFLWSNAMTNMNPEETSIAGQVVKLKKNVPDAIVFTGSAVEAAELITVMRKEGIDIPLIGAEDLMTDDFLAVGKMAEGALAYSGFDADSSDKRTRKFVADYTKRFGAAPTRMAALSYDAYYMLAEAIASAKSLRPTHVRNALMAVKGFRGITGVASMDDTGEAIKEPFLFELQKKRGGYRFVSVK